ncbi:hypothetical protein JCM3765_005374 [Sporobolomyces pararoseus]
MFAKVLESPQEQSAFVSLLEEYFQRPPPIPPSSTAPFAQSHPPHARSTSTARSTPPKPAGLAPSTSSSSIRPAGLVTTNPSNSTSSPPPPSSSTDSFSSKLQTQAAGAALRNTTATSSALRQAGLSQGAANSIAGFGAKHHQTLAPHVANAARQGVKMQMQQEEQQGGPKKPTGLQSSKSMAGVGDTSSGKNFTKALFSSKGALSKAEQDKNKYTGPLYVKPPTAPGTISHAPPPRRAGGAAVPPPTPTPSASAVQADRVKAMYDYEGAETEDLPVAEGEELQSRNMWEESLSHSLASLSLKEPSFSTSYFHILPPELVQAIVEYVAYNRSVVDRKETRKSLRALCSTSKRLKAFAQPLLLANLDLWTSSQVKRFGSLLENQSAGDLELIKRIVIGPFFSNLEGLKSLAKCATRVKDLLVNGKCSMLEPFFGSNITSLTLHLVELCGSSTIFFPSVKTMAIYTDGREGRDGGGVDLQPKLDFPSLQHLTYLPNSRLEEQYTERLLDSVSSTLLSITLPIKEIPSLPLSITENPSISVCHSIDLCETINLGSCLVSNLPSTKHLRLAFGNLRCRIDSARMNESTLLLDTWPSLLELAEQLETLILHAPVLGQLNVRDNLLAPLLKVCEKRKIRVIREEGKFGHLFWDNISPRWIKQVEDSKRDC